jgi:hypothetical protein
MIVCLRTLRGTKSHCCSWAATELRCPPKTQPFSAYLAKIEPKYCSKAGRRSVQGTVRCRAAGRRSQRTMGRMQSLPRCLRQLRHDLHCEIRKWQYATRRSTWSELRRQPDLGILNIADQIISSPETARRLEMLREAGDTDTLFWPGCDILKHMHALMRCLIISFCLQLASKPTHMPVRTAQ